jgi:hypothetical protein
MGNIFETDRKRLLVRAQRFPSYELACSTPRQQQVSNLIPNSGCLATSQVSA